MEDTFHRNFILKRDTKFEVTKKGGEENAEDLLNLIKATFYSVNNLIDGYVVMWNPIIIVGLNT